MLVLGLMGSPRKNGNTNYLLSIFMDEAKSLGAQTKVVVASEQDIAPCKGCAYCEKKGVCIIKDKMSTDLFPLFRKADLIVVSTPMFFYNAPSQLKAIIDRSQTLWSRKYKLKLIDPGRKSRHGFLLSLGATKGNNLFDGIILTSKYFFDAVGTSFDDILAYRRIEKPGDMEKHPTVLKEVKEEVKKLLNPLIKRKKILFACKENACRSQMAASFAQYMAGDKLEVLSGGSNPANKINSVMVEVMAEKGIDMAFRIPESIDTAIADIKPDYIITMGCGEECPAVSGAEKVDWDLPDPAGESIDFIRRIRDNIENKVIELIKNFGVEPVVMYKYSR
ncbi:MAG: NAD(P)H-dependent oxidoreductase [Deltaproteobacteria bacterium]|nr:NAD(P)H-dependent oxidoreductase [Deltaproteobacteria bacterium]